MPLPTLFTSRTRLEITGPDRAVDVMRYFRANRDHLEAGGPPLPDSAFRLQVWEDSATRAIHQYQAGTDAKFAVLWPDGSEVIGTAGLVGIRRGHWQSATVGFTLGTGLDESLAVEAVGGVVDFAFEQLGLHRLELTYRCDDVRSASVGRQVGFAIEGRSVGYSFADGVWWDQIRTGLVNPSAPIPGTWRGRQPEAVG